MRLHPLLLVIAAGCATHPSNATSFDPVGQYAYTSTAEGQTLSGTITIAGQPGAYTAVMTTGGMTRDLLFRTVTVRGHDVTMETELPNSRAVVHLTVDGSAVRGNWALGPRTGELRGSRTPGGR